MDRAVRPPPATPARPLPPASHARGAALPHHPTTPAARQHHASPPAARQPVAAPTDDPSDSPTTPTSPRAPNPDKKVTGKDELHSVITRQAVAEERETTAKPPLLHISAQSSTARADLAAATNASPNSPPSAMSTQKAASRGQAMAHRTASIDSTVSSVSSSSTSQRFNGTNAYRVSQDTSGPQDAAAMIVAAGSAEAALHKVLNEKQQAASHNAQLWRLVEKQRAMILGLNKDLEKALKEKERYRRKLKDHLAQSASAPALITTSGITADTDSQEASPASLQAERAVNASRDISIDSRKVSEAASEVLSVHAGRSDTPQDTTQLPSPQSASSVGAASRELDGVQTSSAGMEARSKTAVDTTQQSTMYDKDPTTPRDAAIAELSQAASKHQKTESASSWQRSPPPSAQSFSSPKTRKAPPAPLRLDPQRPEQSVTNNIIDASDSEYEEDPESARSEYQERGRRKTREEDDREREALARLEEEHQQQDQRQQQDEEKRSKSKRNKLTKSRSKSKGQSKSRLPTAESDAVPPVNAEASAQESTQQASHRQPVFDETTNPADVLRSRARSDATGTAPHTSSAALLTPGLPMSPRPGDRPPNSPMPRAPNAIANSIPMSPKAGLPLSPRAPRQAIPLPPQTPLAVISPHLDRAKNYQLQAQQQPQAIPSAVDQLKASSDGSSENDRPSISSDHVAQTPGEIYRGLVTDQYPDLLLPPNALPSILVRTASSRMQPSRASFIMPKHADETVFTLAVQQRADKKQLWRVEKTFAALAALDHQVKSVCTLRDRLPDKALFAGHAPAKIDARRLALNYYLEKMLDSVTHEKAALMVCRFLSTDAIAGEGGDYFTGAHGAGSRPESPITRLKPNMAGYLTKRGKNFGGWKARYFVLDGPNLKYFEGRGGAQLGSIKLQNAQIGKQSSTNSNSQDDEDNQFRHAFLILEPKKKDSSSLVRHVLCAESDDERDQWVEALLRYVDYQDDDEQQLPGRQAQVSKVEVNYVPQSPRLQKSMSDLRPMPNNSSREGQQIRSTDQVRAVNYSETVAGEAPVMGPPPGSPRMAQTPSPPYDSVSSGPAEPTTAPHPTISGPTNLQMISNSGEWGMKPPPTPGNKDKKRSMFSNLSFTRGRSSSDLAPNEGVKTPGHAAHGSRGVFGIPLGEAVEFAHPGIAETQLPAVVYRCIEYLTAKNAVAEEGIFRMSGSNTVIRALKERFNAEGDVDLLSTENTYDVHAVASLLKLYLRELPASILTRELHLDFLHCLELSGEEKVMTLNRLVNKLPWQNRALLEALSAFMLLIVDNVAKNRMNVRNLGVVFSPTLNLPGPLISVFVEEQRRIFGPPLDVPSSMTDPRIAATIQQSAPNDLRSPRKQMFSDLPTPAYNQSQFQNLNGIHEDTGMTPMQPQYASYQMAPQGDGAFGSLNDALRSPTVYSTTATGEPTPRELKKSRRESGMLNIMGPQKKASSSRLRDEQSTSF